MCVYIPRGEGSYQPLPFLPKQIMGVANIWLVSRCAPTCTQHLYDSCRFDYAWVELCGRIPLLFPHPELIYVFLAECFYE